MLMINRPLYDRIDLLPDVSSAELTNPTCPVQLSANGASDLCASGKLPLGRPNPFDPLCR